MVFYYSSHADEMFRSEEEAFAADRAVKEFDAIRQSYNKEQEAVRQKYENRLQKAIKNVKAATANAVVRLSVAKVVPRRRTH